MRRYIPTAMLGLVLLSLAACETTNEDEWNGSGVKPFDQAEETCEEQADGLRVDDDRGEFFTACMASFGWTPKGGASPVG